DAEKAAEADLAETREEVRRGRAEVEELLAGARAEAEAELRRAADETAWARRTVESVIAAANAEAQATRAAGHMDVGAHLRVSRRRLQAVIGRLADRLRTEADQTRSRAEELEAAAAEVLAAAERDGSERRARAESEATAILE